MSVGELESQIAQLSSEDLAEFAAWFDRFYSDAWDAKIEQDSRDGQLDALIRQANEAFDAGKCKPL